MAYYLPFIAKIPENAATGISFSNAQIRNIKTLQFSTRQIAGIAPVEAFSTMLQSLLADNQTIRLIREDCIEIQDGSLCKCYVLEHTKAYTRFALCSVTYGKRKITIFPNGSIALSCKKEMMVHDIPHTDPLLQELMHLFLFSDAKEMYLEEMVEAIQNIIGTETVFTVETPSGRKYTIKPSKRALPKTASIALTPLDDVQKPANPVCVYSSYLQKRDLHTLLNIGEREEQFLKHSTFAYWHHDLGLILEALGMRTPICLQLNEDSGRKYLKGETQDNVPFSCSLEEDRLILSMHHIQYVYAVVYKEEATYLVLRKKTYFRGKEPSLCMQIEDWDTQRNVFLNLQIEHYGNLCYKCQKEEISLEALREVESTLLTEPIEHWTLRQFVERFGNISV